VVSLYRLSLETDDLFICRLSLETDVLFMQVVFRQYVAQLLMKIQDIIKFLLKLYKTFPMIYMSFLSLNFGQNCQCFQMNIKVMTKMR